MPVEPSHFCFPATDIQWVLPSTLHPATLSSGRLLVERSPHQRPGASSCRDSALMAFRVQVRFLATMVEAAAIGHRTGATMHRCGVKVVRVSPCLFAGVHCYACFKEHMQHPLTAVSFDDLSQQAHGVLLDMMWQHHPCFSRAIKSMCKAQIQNILAS